MKHVTPEKFRQTISARFAKVALAPELETTFPVGPESAKSLGYEPNEIDALPASVTDSFCGVGNPFGLGQVQPGEKVLDLGSGAGMDGVLAARRVGPSGSVIGVDMTSEMVAKATHNAVAAGVVNVEFRRGTLEDLPVEDASIDVALSNGVFNLCGDKPKVLSEVFRVLRRGGRLQMADVLLHEGITPEEVAEKGSWSD